MNRLCCFSSSQLGEGHPHSSSGRGKSREGMIKFGFSLVKGKANHPMEDYHVAKFMKIHEHELGLFAIYDGHLGKHLFANILKEEEFWVDPSRAISKAYEKTDQVILSNSSDLGRGGSTAVIAILINGIRLWVANVGDSRAVLSRGGQAIQMTTDHEPNTERGSIENRGGFVSNMPVPDKQMLMYVLYTHVNVVSFPNKTSRDVPRVNGQLAVSRAFGDKNLKSHLRSDPDIQNTNVMSNQEAVDIARKIKEPPKAAKQLIAEAVQRDSKDDISCVVVRFRG
ncbi:hypothetical protein V6N12_065672 [Hibiscus sabdariffa]|uniref:PPM-type phosphatase domain-containing protein n=1 Tax=Hibiscus sabdariffa TaxID=183260 RepID=A0ABR2G9E5_9ROSI